jgi:3-deoxy-D-manno-octulosonic acid kinase
MPPPFEPVKEMRIASPQGAILFDAARIPQVDSSLLEPRHWPELGKRGRTAVRRVQGSFGPAVLRSYRRGGLVARFSRDRYLWTGEDRTRPFSEFRLLAHMRSQGLPVPAPLAAGYRRTGLLYQASILTAEIVQATTLAEQLSRSIGEIATWRTLGETLARFHALGICHADLNAHNLLQDADHSWWLIDFDRGVRRTVDARWPQSRLARLQRSLLKLGAAQLSGWPQAWQQLCAAHDSALHQQMDALPRQ